MEKKYNPSEHEDRIYKKWEESGAFNPDNEDKDAEAFSIAMPPPNATGQLHIGHALFLALQDIMIRTERMKGKKALWLPGTDHAAIATASKVEKILWEEEKKTRHDLGREKFLEKVDAFVEDSQDTIRNQFRKMGASCDWSREQYMLDPHMREAVQKAFIDMHSDGLIYKGYRTINWDPKMQTTVANDEVEYVEEKTKFYYFQYGPFVIGTARPETKFADKVVIVHPEDERYTEYHGKTITVEWINGPIEATIIADEASDKDFGSGVMTITPAHSAIDFELAEKYNLEMPQIIDFDGKLTEAAGGFAGMPIEEAREKIVEKLDKKGLLVKVDEEYVHNLATNYRGGGTIEPQIMSQWFVNVDKPSEKLDGKSLKERSLEVIAEDTPESEQIEFIPKRFEKTYQQWMENLHNWCISRQIWFGHRIPAWYAKNDIKKENPIVSAEKPEGNYIQESDTLDTWFSSALWTFTTLGWPKKTEDLQTFHPTSVMETGYDIMPFWVSRMILMGTYHMDEVPFKKVYLHGLVRDKMGRKMSKSLGNGIDPIDMIDKFGTDALRLALVIGITPGNDSRMFEEKIKGYRNFATKLWNIARFCKGREVTLSNEAPTPQTAADHWILSKLSTLIEETKNEYDKFNFGQLGEKLYSFAWHDFADWYIETAKNQEDTKNTNHILGFVLQNMLKLLHPYTPFITEALWENFDMKSDLITESLPTKENTSISFNETEAKKFEDQQQAIVSERKNKDVAENKVKYQKQIQDLEKFIAGLEKKLQNEQFTANAPEEVVEREQQKLKDFTAKKEELKKLLEN